MLTLFEDCRYDGDNGIVTGDKTADAECFDVADGDCLLVWSPLTFTLKGGGRVWKPFISDVDIFVELTIGEPHFFSRDAFAELLLLTESTNRFKRNVIF